LVSGRAADTVSSLRRAGCSPGPLRR